MYFSLSLGALEAPSYPVELDEERFTIPTSFLVERPISPSESVSEESISVRSEGSLTDDDDDWQRSDELAHIVVPNILKISEDQKKPSQFEGQCGKVRTASGEGGGQPQQQEQPHDAESPEEDNDDIEEGEDEQEDEQEDNEPAAPIRRRRSSDNSVAGLGSGSTDSNESNRVVPVDMANEYGQEADVNRRMAIVRDYIDRNRQLGQNRPVIQVGNVPDPVRFCLSIVFYLKFSGCFRRVETNRCANLRAPSPRKQSRRYGS